MIEIYLGICRVDNKTIKDIKNAGKVKKSTFNAKYVANKSKKNYISYLLKELMMLL
jgi:hypothetical protein